MKKIPMCVVPKVEIAGKMVNFTYRGQLIEIMRTPSAGGADLEELRRSLRILDQLDKVENGGTLSLEDADFEIVKARLLATKWPLINRVVLQFVEDVTDPK